MDGMQYPVPEGNSPCRMRDSGLRNRLGHLKPRFAGGITTVGVPVGSPRTPPWSVVEQIRVKALVRVGR